MAVRGAAWRRRQRRLRSMLRHERQTVRMELAAALHHSWGGGLGTHEGLRAQKTASAGPAEYFELSSDDGRPAGGSGRRPCWSRGRRRGTGGTRGSGMRSPRISMFLCRRWGNSCRTSSSSSPLVCRWLPSRLSKCRRSSWTRLRSAWGIVCASRRWWNSWCMCRLSCLILRSSSLLPSRSLTFQFRVEMEEGYVEVFKVLSQDRIQQHCPSSRPLTFQFQVVQVEVRGGLQGFAGQSSTASSSHVGAADGAGQGVFRTFPRKKKSAKQGPHSGSELSADFNPSTLSAHQMPPEQLVDVPVPQVHERTSYEQETRFLLESLHRRWEAEEAARLALLEEEQTDEEEEEEEVEVSRFLPHFRPRRCACRQHLPSWMGLHICTP